MDARTKRDINLVNVAGALGSIYGTIVFGELLLFFVTQCLKVPKETWALVASLLPLMQAFHLASAILTEHLKRRKLLSLGCFAVSRLTVPAITLLPFVTGEKDLNFRLYYLAAALITNVSISALGEAAWSSWIADIVPEKERAGFFSRRWELTIVASILAGALAGRIVSWLHQDSPWGYVVTFGFAFLVGELDLIIHSAVADRPMPEARERVRLGPMLLEPWKHSGFRNLMLQRMIVGFGDSCVGPFGIMYLIEELRLDAATITVLGAFFQLWTALSLRLWRRVGDRYGYRTIYLITHTMYGLGIIYWWFLPYHNFALALVILLAARVYFGFLNGGLSLAVGTLTFNTAPEKHRSIYFAQITVCISVTMALGIFCGRWIYMHTNPADGVMFCGTKLTGTHVLIGLFGLFRLVTIRMFFNRIPDATSEAAMPRIARMAQANPFRVLPSLLEFPTPVTPEERTEHVNAMLMLVPPEDRKALEEDMRAVLRDRVHAEDEFYGIIGRERIARGRGLERMLDEAEELARLHLPPARARASARRILRLYGERDFARCLRAVRRLAHHVATDPATPVAESALSVIDALSDRAAGGEKLEQEAVLLAVYACLQIVREPRE